jgi:hypothetical protein
MTSMNGHCLKHYIFDCIITAGPWSHALFSFSEWCNYVLINAKCVYGFMFCVLQCHKCQRWKKKQVWKCVFWNTEDVFCFFSFSFCKMCELICVPYGLLIRTPATSHWHSIIHITLGYPAHKPAHTRYLQAVQTQASLLSPGNRSLSKKLLGVDE